LATHTGAQAGTHRRASALHTQSRMSSLSYIQRGGHSNDAARLFG
jgi:hypothetical protein